MAGPRPRDAAGDPLSDALARAWGALAGAPADDPRARLLLVALEAVVQLGGLPPAESARRADLAITALLGKLLGDEDLPPDTPRIGKRITPGGREPATRPHDRPAAEAPKLGPFPTRPSERPVPEPPTRPIARAEAPRDNNADDPARALRSGPGASREPSDATRTSLRVEAEASDPTETSLRAGEPPRAGEPAPTKPGGRPAGGASPRDPTPQRAVGAAPGPGAPPPAGPQPARGASARMQAAAAAARAAGHPLQVEAATLAKAWPALGRGALDPEPGRALDALARADLEQGDEARFHVALVRALDRARSAARHGPDEVAVRARTDDLLRRAIEGAVALGVRVHPDAGQSGSALARGEHGPGCPVTRKAAWGEAGRVIDVEQHGVVFADGRAEPAVLLLGAGPAPPWHGALCDGLTLFARHAGAVPDATELARALRGWIDELPGVDDGERRQTTLRFAATAIFQAAAVVPGFAAPFALLAQALEAGGSYLIPLEPTALSDARRYELVLRPGAGVPRLLRPGFMGGGNVVQQRARVLADPSWLGPASA